MSSKSKSSSIRRQFTDWLHEKYGASYLPKHFYILLDQVYKGTYKGLAQPVPIEDLWDMWERKFPQLEQLYVKNCARGKNMDGMARIMYDLSILLSKYDSYLEWKSRQSAASISGGTLDKPIDCNKLFINNYGDKEIDIDSTIKEIWGGDED